MVMNRLFGGKKRAEDEQKSAPEAPSTPPAQQRRAKKEKKKRPDEMLSSVISETVPAPILDILRQNEKYEINGDYIVGLVDVNDQHFGGLSARSDRGNSEKGSLVAAIRSNQINIIATADMLDSEFFSLIPNAQSVERASEYSVMVNTPYLVGLVKPKGPSGFEFEVCNDNGQLLMTNLQTFKRINDGQMSVGDAFPSLMKNSSDVDDLLDDDTQDNPATQVPGAAPQMPPAPPAPTPGMGPQIPSAPQPMPQQAPPMPTQAPGQTPQQAPQQAPTQGSSAVPPLAPTSEPVVEEEPTPDVEPDIEPDIEENYDDDIFGDDDDIDFTDDDTDDNIDTDEEDDDDDDPGFGGDIQQVEFDEDSAPYEETDEVREYAEKHSGKSVDARAINTVVNRTITVGDLKFEVDYADFESTFAEEPPRVSFNPDIKVSDWLKGIIQAKVDQANAQLAAKAEMQHAERRSKYAQFMNTHSERVMQNVSYDNADAPYGGYRDEAFDLFSRAEAASEEERGAREAELKKRLQEEADATAEASAQKARRDYLERNKTAVNEEIARLGNQIERRNIQKRDANLREIEELRHADAQMQMETGKTRFISYLLKKSSEDRVEMEELLSSLTGELNELVSKHISDDVNRVSVAQHELEHSRDVEVLKGQLAQSEEDFRTRLAQYEKDAEEKHAQLESQHMRKVEMLEDQHMQQLNTQEFKYNEARNRISELEQEQQRYREDIGIAEQRGEQRAEMRADAELRQLRNTNDTQARELDMFTRSAQSRNLLMIGFLIGIAIIGILTGLIIGIFIGGSGSIDTTHTLTTLTDGVYRRFAMF